MATTEELLKKNTESTGTGTTTGTPAAGGSTSSYTTARTDAINKLYDAQQAQREAELKNAYQQNLSAQQAAQQKIAPQYRTAANDLGAQYERNRLNFARQAAASGINTGTAAQESLARAGQYQRDFGNLRQSEAEAQAEAERSMANLEASYKSSVASALAQNDYNRANALLNEYNNGYQRDLQNAQIAAQYGDFSLFGNLYGQEQADAMAALWRAQNPDLAYNTGRITADEYFVMTGRRPAGYTASGGKTLSDLVNGMLPGRTGGGGGTTAGNWGGYASGKPGPSLGKSPNGIPYNQMGIYNPALYPNINDTPIW